MGTAGGPKSCAAALPNLKCLLGSHAGTSTRQATVPPRAQWGLETHVGATDLEAALKIIMGPDAATRRHRLKSKQKSCRGPRGGAIGAVAGKWGGQSTVSLVAREERFQKPLPSLTFSSTVNVPQFLGTAGGLGTLFSSSPPPLPVPPLPPQLSHLPVVPGERCLAADSAVGLCHGDGSSCRRRAFVTICQNVPLPPRSALLEHF